MGLFLVMVSVVGYEGFYKVDSNGNVFSEDRIITDANGTQRKMKGRKLKQHITDEGYPFVGLHKDGKNKVVKVHRIVGLSLIPNPKGLRYLNHKNGIKTDNRAENLEWCTKSHDAKEAIRIGIRRVKLNADAAKSIRDNRGTLTAKDQALKYRVSVSTINRVLSGEVW